MPTEQIEASEEYNDELEPLEDCELFESEDEMCRSLKRFCYGDLYVIGRIWIETLKSVLVGAKICLIPVVKAGAAPFQPPQKPPPMKYTDLPLYGSPHIEYKDYMLDKGKCSEANTKLLHEFLYPYVRSCRKKTQQSYTDFSQQFKSMGKDIRCSIKNSKNNFKKYMRDPNNLELRQAVVAMGAATGFYLGSGKGVPRRLFLTGLGALGTGALCFPKETDGVFRSFLHNSGKFVLTLYNSYCGKNAGFRKGSLCNEDLPQKPKE